MRPFKRLISYEQALSLTSTSTVPTKKTERLSLVEAVGRVSAEDVVSKMSVPPFPRSAMDGYAVRARDTFGASKLKPVKLSQGETILVGSVPKKALTKGACAMIATGAMMPKGADAVVMVEDTEVEGKAVLFHESVHPGQNVSRKGEDITPATKIISSGQVLNPGKIGALAAIGRKEIRAYARPLVGVVSTGNEITELGSELGPGKVYNINSYTLCGAISSNGGQVRMLGIVNDTIEDIERVVTENSDCDILVFSGGSSVGERDIMVDVLERNGKVVFHGIAMKPGKPTLFGTIGEQLVFGMPGHPTSCLSNAYLLLTPGLRKMARLPMQWPANVQARIAKRVVSTTGRTQFLTVRIEGDIAHPAFKESGAITSMAFADGYVVIPADVDMIEKGERVTVYLL
jgi:molybdenum cofactor synthesis domain-containing protein